MVSKRIIKETRNLLYDFGIIEDRNNFKIPSDISTEAELERWRKDKISKHLDKIEKN